MSLTADDLLRSFPLLTGGLDAADADRMVAWLQRGTLEEGQVLVAQDQPNDSLFLLARGRLVLSLAAEGRVLHLGEVEPGGWVGELSLLRPDASSVTVTAAEPCEVRILTHADFEMMRRAWPATAACLIHTLTLSLVERLRSSAAQVLRPLGDGAWALGPAADRGGPAGLV